MKLNINYDLIDKIQEAQGKYKLQRFSKNTFKYVLRYGWGFSLAVTVDNLVCLNNNLITADQAFLDIAVSMGVFLGLSGLCVATTDMLLAKIFGKTPDQFAMEELRRLSLKLNQQNVKTSGELLLDSKEYYREHKFVVSENGVPGIMQNKFINIPTYNNGSIEETSILQEHKIGSKKYVLSLGSPTKSQVFKPAYGI